MLAARHDDDDDNCISSAWMALVLDNPQREICH